ncbi:MAG: XRE family transcriptional regulator [Elusimicrobia bacterium]|nr:XRE family transcriptional regulator [Elusimicrobiota bacterium]
MKFNEKLLLLLMQHKVSQKDFALALSTSPALVSNWIGGKFVPNAESMAKIAAFFDKPMSYFLPSFHIEAPSGDFELKEERVLDKLYKMEVDYIPILGTSSATREIFMLEETPESFLPIAKSHPHDFAVKVKGDCMVDKDNLRDSIFDGDYIVVRPNAEVKNGDIVVAKLGKDESTIKRFYRSGKNIELVPDNADCQTIKKPASEIEVLGKVVYVHKITRSKPKRKLS